MVKNTYWVLWMMLGWCTCAEGSACAEGTYAVNGTCMPLTVCSPGFYETVAATEIRDRQCAICPPNSFCIGTYGCQSCGGEDLCPGGSGLLACRVCQYDEYMTRSCSSTQDTRCVGCTTCTSG